MGTTQHNFTPAISVLIPTFNEEGYIRACIESLTCGDYPSESLEILLLDGGSSDQTLAKAANAKLNGAKLICMDNPKKIVPAAMNIGIEHAEHEVLIWVGAHAIYKPGYLNILVETLLTEDCSSVGGILEPIGRTFVGKIIASATSSKFGIGNAGYRFAKHKQQVDTVFGGCWHKTDIINIGGFNEDWVRNQDYELNCRLRADVGPIILNPLAKCQYYCRNSLGKLAKQYYNYGYWRLRTVMRHKDSFSARLAAPVILLAGLIISLFLAIAGSKLSMIVPAIYLLALLVVTARKSLIESSLSKIFLFVIFPTIHLSWATGFAISCYKYCVHSPTHSTKSSGKA